MHTLDSDSDDEYFFTNLIAREEAKKVAGLGGELSLDSDSPSNKPDEPSGDHGTMAKLGMFADFVLVGPKTMTDLISTYYLSHKALCIHDD